MKWDWLESRILEKGYKTNAAFAKAIDWPSTRISELIHNSPVNGGKQRRIPANRIAVFAEKLGIDAKSLLDYNEDRCDFVRFSEAENESNRTDYDKEIIILIYETVHTFLQERNLQLKPRKEIELVFSLYDKIKDTPRQNRMAEIISIAEILAQNQVISA